MFEFFSNIFKPTRDTIMSETDNFAALDEQMRAGMWHEDENENLGIIQSIVNFRNPMTYLTPILRFRLLWLVKGSFRI